MAGVSARVISYGGPPEGMEYDPVTKGWRPTIASTNGYPAGSTTPVGDANVAASNKTASQSAAATGANYNVTQNGGTDYSNASAQERLSQDNAAKNASAAQIQSAKLQADAEARRLAALSTSFNTGSQDLLPHVTGSSIASDENAARAASFGRAKDQAGQIARSALTAVEENVAGRGVAGGGIEALQKAGALQDAEAPLQDLTREQYIQDLNRSADISDQTYQGNIAQRGQDVTQKNAQRASLLAMINNAFAPALY